MKGQNMGLKRKHEESINPKKEGKLEECVHQKGPSIQEKMEGTKGTKGEPTPTHNN